MRCSQRSHPFIVARCFGWFPEATDRALASNRLRQPPSLLPLLLLLLLPPAVVLRSRRRQAPAVQAGVLCCWTDSMSGQLRPSTELVPWTPTHHETNASGNAESAATLLGDLRFVHRFGHLVAAEYLLSRPWSCVVDCSWCTNEPIPHRHCVRFFNIAGDRRRCDVMSVGGLVVVAIAGGF